jgi:hypothetical protein
LAVGLAFFFHITQVAIAEAEKRGNDGHVMIVLPVRSRQV